MLNQISFDGVDYKLSALNQEAMDKIFNLQKVDAEIQRLEFLLAIAQKARTAYATALNAALPKK